MLQPLDDRLPVAIDGEDDVMTPQLVAGIGAGVGQRPVLVRGGFSSPTNVHGLAPAGSSTSPRWQIHTLSGDSAHAPHPEPQVQPSCERSASGNGFGQSGTTS